MFKLAPRELLARWMVFPPWCMSACWTCCFVVDKLIPTLQCHNTTRLCTQMANLWISSPGVHIPYDVPWTLYFKMNLTFCWFIIFKMGGPYSRLHNVFYICSPDRLLHLVFHDGPFRDSAGHLDFKLVVVGSPGVRKAQGISPLHQISLWHGFMSMHWTC